MIDLTKPVETVTGIPVRIVSTAMPGEFPVLGIYEEGGRDRVLRTTLQGSVMMFPGQSDFDLRNVREETIEYRTVRSQPNRDTRLQLGLLSNETVEAARELITSSPSLWDGILKLTRDGDRLVNVEFLNA